MELFLTGALTLLLLAAAISDLRSRTISNALNLTIALTAIPMWWMADYSLWPDIVYQVGAAFAIFLIFVALFAVGAMGGGDVKMIGALCLWIPIPLILPAMMVMAIAGGLLSAAMLIRSKLSRQTTQIQVPYGVAIAAAGIWVLHEHYLNQFSVTAFA